MLYLMTAEEEEVKENEFVGFVKTIKKAMKKEIRLLKQDFSQSFKAETMLVNSKAEEQKKEIKTEMSRITTEISQVKTEMNLMSDKLDQILRAMSK